MHVNTKSAAFVVVLVVAAALGIYWLQARNAPAPVPPSPMPTLTPRPSVKLYENPDFNYSLSYPSSWKMDEHSADGEHITYVAFDPDMVLTEAEHVGLDRPAGRVSVSVTDEMLIDTVGMESVLIGPDKLQAWRESYPCTEPSCPNPYWVGREDRRYYVPLPESHQTDGMMLITIGVDLAATDVGNAEIEAEIDRILASFKLE